MHGDYNRKPEQQNIDSCSENLRHLHFISGLDSRTVQCRRSENHMEQAYQHHGRRNDRRNDMAGGTFLELKQVDGIKIRPQASIF